MMPRLQLSVNLRSAWCSSSSGRKVEDGRGRGRQNERKGNPAMFKDEQQRAQCCKALLCTLPKFSEDLGAWWDDYGPTEHFIESTHAGPLTHGEQILLQCVLDFWNGEGGAKFDNVIYRLDFDRARAVLSLALAVQEGEHAIDRWLAKAETGGEPPAVVERVDQLLSRLSYLRNWLGKIATMSDRATIQDARGLAQTILNDDDAAHAVDALR